MSEGSHNAAGSDDVRHLDVEHHDVRTSSRKRRAEHQAGIEKGDIRDEEVLTRLTTGELGSGSNTKPAECGDNGKPNEALGGTPPVPSQRVVLLPDDSVISPVMLEHSTTEARALQWDGSKGVTTTPLSLDQILQAECEDEEASPSEKAVQFGPLAPDAIREELAKHEFDAQRPMRPVRIKPIGAVEEDTEAFKAFRHAAFEGDFPIRLVEKNPKRVESKSYDRRRKYSSATTLRQIVELCATSKNYFPIMSITALCISWTQLLLLCCAAALALPVSLKVLMVSVAQPKQMRRVNHKMQPVTSETPMR